MNFLFLFLYYELNIKKFFSIGPSGPNREYLLNLASGLRTIAPDAYDGHLFDLENRVLDLIKRFETL